MDGEVTNVAFRGKSQHLHASPSISYHSPSASGGNFSFLLDYGGKDEYGCGAENNTFNQRGTAGRFLTDRPKQEELEKAVERKKTETAKTP